MGKRYEVEYANGSSATLTQEEWDQRSHDSGVEPVKSFHVVDDTPTEPAP